MCVRHSLAAMGKVMKEVGRVGEKNAKSPLRREIRWRKHNPRYGYIVSVLQPNNEFRALEQLDRPKYVHLCQRP
jgi:hypothetical protein